MPIKGFKVMKPDFTCRGFQFEVGKTYTHQGSIHPCSAGFHFCEKLVDTFNYYEFDPNNRVTEIEALGEVLSEDDKSVTNIIRIVREISWVEMLDMVNTGKGNTGRSNAGDSNAGNRNAGDSNAGNRNAGDSNAGHYNAGHYNAGNRNAGHYNAGDSNAGNRNAGHYNAGDFNSCNWSAGTFCSVEPPFLLFNKVSPISRDEIRWHPGFRAARQLRVTDDEGNAIEYKQAWSNLWSELSNPEKISIQSLPNFDADVFEEITGIRV